ncbi:MAG: hypothetical protein HOP19_14170 [Acidobacteria bacterium]|nr:hypothetical protein [Acidobacteriota bacterium]
MKKIGLLTGCLLAACLVSLAAKQARNMFEKSVSATTSSNRSNATITTTKFNPPLQEKKESTPIESFVVGGTNLLIEAAREHKDRGSTEINYTITNKRTENLNDFRYLLLDFDAGNTLSRIEGRRLEINLNPSEKRDITILPERPVESGHTLLLAINAFSDNSNIQEVEVKELIRALKKYKAKKDNPILSLKVKSKNQRRSEPDFCHAAFSFAHILGEDNDGTPVGAFTCNQYAESFLVTFAGDNAKPK